MNKQIIDEAAEWFVEINEESPDHATRQRFHAWLTRSPEHAHAYLKVLPIWQEGRRLDTYPDDPEALIAWAQTESNVFPMAASASNVAETPVRRAKPWTGVAAAIAASVGVAAAMLYVGFQMISGVYRTDTGEHVLITLTDQSTVELNSRSKVKVRFDASERSVELLEGQAMFKVAKDAARPFVVKSGRTSVRALGTQFDVYRKSTGTVVTVVEGKVAVASVVLTAGEQVTVTATTASAPKETDVTVATAWTQQQLVFFRAPLAEVVEEFNRYNKRQLVVRDKLQLKERRISGTFSSTDPASLMRFLRDQPGLRVEERDGEIVIDLLDDPAPPMLAPS